MLQLTIQTQPDDVTCGPTSLHALYQYYGFEISLEQIIDTVEKSLSGGTLAPMLGIHAQQHGFNTFIYVYNVSVFDPTWFIHGEVSNSFLYDKLIAQMRYKNDPNITIKTLAYCNYLQKGGTVRFKNLNPDLLKKYFNLGIPIITSLSATYLYSSSREYFTHDGKSVYDDIQGSPCGHFVVLCGYDEPNKHVVIADPHQENPLSHNNYYKVSIYRLINAIMLGVLTYDANLLIIEPKER